MIGVYRVARVSFSFFLFFYFHPLHRFFSLAPEMVDFFFSNRNNCYDSHAEKKKGSRHHRVFNSISVTHGVATCQVKIHKLYAVLSCRMNDYRRGVVVKPTVAENRIIALRAINVR